MPNHVTNRLTFAADKAAEVFAAVCPEGSFDFEKLVPSPLNMYHGNLSRENEQDFPINWHEWSRLNWGTKWNAYDCKCEVIGDKAVITFDTAWSCPYPILAAFCNKFQIPFEHRYFDEGSNFWGIEVWDKPKMIGGRIQRVDTRKSNKEDYRGLAIELKGVDPEALDEDDE